MGLWPNKEERTPLQTRFWVNGEDGIVSCGVSTESIISVEQRLRATHPLYRALGNLVRKSASEGGSHEV